MSALVQGCGCWRCESGRSSSCVKASLPKAARLGPGATAVEIRRRLKAHKITNKQVSVRQGKSGRAVRVSVKTWLVPTKSVEELLAGLNHDMCFVNVSYDFHALDALKIAVEEEMSHTDWRTSLNVLGLDLCAPVPGENRFRVAGCSVSVYDDSSAATTIARAIAHHGILLGGQVTRG